MDGMDEMDGIGGTTVMISCGDEAPARGMSRLESPLTSILMRRRRWREECHDFDISSCSAASSERANRDRRWMCGDEMHRLK